MLTPSDLPVLRRATFQAPSIEPDDQHEPSKRRRRARSKPSGGSVVPTAEGFATTADAPDAATAAGSVTEPTAAESTLEVTVVPADGADVIEGATEVVTVDPRGGFDLPEELDHLDELDHPDDLDRPDELDRPEERGDRSGRGSDAATTAATTASTAATDRGAASAPRHRAERIRNRRAVAGAPTAAAGRTGAGKGGAGASVRRTAALGSAVAFIGLSAFGAILPAADADASDSLARGDSANANSTAQATSTADADSIDAAALDSITPAPEAEARPAITSGLSTEAAPFTGGTQVTVQGRSLDEVASVTVGSTPATIVAADDAKITFQVPAVAEGSAGAAVDVTMADADGEPVEVVTTEAPASTAATTVASLISSADATEVQQELAAGEKPAEPLVLTYTSDPGIDAQLQYVLTYWSSYNSAQYPVFGGVDCANFASQSLIARGWAMDAGWFYDGGTGTMSSSWSSSTALRDYLLGQPARATALDDSQRAQVKVGDIAQFDWDSSGDRDHTAVVTRVEHTDAGTKVWVGGHTKDIDFWDVDVALASGGGSVTYFSIH
ncbi:amidase domain-containing protein [Agromyces salentinus]|uniref:IPT/TIG domain-containing protein n=1 Tax=Agromyces salentinus TaxID=269421 RepID=A0ABN2MVD6_9MICO|nr:amidase domain-containing protein [Agromyces salentinus]